MINDYYNVVPTRMAYPTPSFKHKPTKLAKAQADDLFIDFFTEAMNGTMNSQLMATRALQQIQQADADPATILGSVEYYSRSTARNLDNMNKLKMMNDAIFEKTGIDVASNVKFYMPDNGRSLSNARK